jgi:fumarate reductase subunit C
VSPGAHHYTLYRPRWYRRRVSVWWWLAKGAYRLFVLRELTSVAVALFAFVTLAQLRALAHGPEAYARFLEWTRTPAAIALHAVALAAVLYHSFTWFNLAPKALVAKLGGRRVPDAGVVAANYIAWVAASLLLAWLVLGPPR